MIRVRGISKTYQMGNTLVKALDGVDLHIPQNEFVAIMGPSGSGKSTLMNILGCLDQPDNGSYQLAGEEVASIDDDQLASLRNRSIGFVFQTFNLQARRTALENVMLPLRFSNCPKVEARERATQILSKVGLAERAHHRPSELSGGQRQRVAIARALINQPEIILADEPTGNLDSKTTEEIMNLFHHLHQQGQTIVVVTHEDEIAQHAQRVVTLRDGKIKEDKFND
ncbi:ABC transporter ATP-binding protein [Aliikangiella coralliicola]|uniref:ABC transporter ATP-binding protein n=1 Tax=Aliikangiella coralliicola TaxID=2592383 RepID=A0A545UI75_9GAMM|nr:ABC transporter ATP-binding protein [Aliikangiella coralliicola]TQV89167.1 ABC transporter ATP-binding protein [Aliikangiella coralliicola]